MLPSKACERMNAWQVHRLNPVAYEADCQHAIGRVIRLDEDRAFKFTDGTDSQSR